MAISTGRQVVRAWLAITVIFELIAIARIYVLGHPLKEVLPLHGADGPAHFVRYWAFVAALLAVIRLGTILHIESKASWFTTAATHVLELCVYTYWVVTDGVLPTDPSQIKAAHAPGLFIWCVPRRSFAASHVTPQRAFSSLSPLPLRQGHHPGQCPHLLILLFQHPQLQARCSHSSSRHGRRCARSYGQRWWWPPQAIVDMPLGKGVAAFAALGLPTP